MTCCSGEDDDEQQQTEAPRVRGCTDIFWLCLFIAFWFLMIVVAAFAFVYGHPIRLINGYDSFGNTCGVKNNPKIGTLELSGQDTSDKPYLFFLDGKNPRKSLQICVKECPNRILNNITDVCKFYEETKSQLCHDKPGSGFSACKDLHSEPKKNTIGSCPEYPVYASRPLLNRCIPSSVTEVTKKLYEVLNSWDVIEKVLGDLCKTWREILALLFLAFVLSLFMIALFHLLASVVTWIVMILVMIACIGGTGLLWWTYIDIKRQLDGIEVEQHLDESDDNKNTFLVLAIIATIFTVAIFCIICFVRAKISFMASLFRESAKCLADLPGLFFQPLLTFFALILFFAFWVIVILCLATANVPSTRAMNSIDSLTLNSSHGNIISSRSSDEKLSPLNIPLNDYKTFTLVDYVDDTWVKYMWWVYIIGLIWISEFITACQTMVISGAVAHWYFRGKNASVSPVCSSISTLVSYHLGSVACGSFLITVFKLPRLLLTYLHQKFEKTKETSPCAQCGLRCCICCFYCLERFIRYMNHNAYTVIAIEGTHFCNAARIAFNTILSNALQVAVINGIGDFVLFLGKCFVTAATGSIGLLFMRQNTRLHFYAIPVIVTCIFAFFIAHCVISLYETVIDTLFLCICEDKNLNGDNGNWRQSALAQLASDSNINTNGQQSHELAPMNS
ncbi:choline transporter-like 1 [Phymastichus coffea]|uniref:choline transporter-like 1 n=1 Tax=Phymastichus coffea TaxID=108790 RepID=UPI00273C020B|nr:choline transporter-like 1 [Phymastichus coffea]